MVLLEVVSKFEKPQEYPYILLSSNVMDSKGCIIQKTAKSAPPTQTVQALGPERVIDQHVETPQGPMEVKLKTRR